MTNAGKIRLRNTSKSPIRVVGFRGRGTRKLGRTQNHVAPERVMTGSWLGPDVGGTKVVDFRRGVLRGTLLVHYRVLRACATSIG